MRFSGMAVCFSRLFSPAVVCAGSNGSDDSAEMIRALLARVEHLEKRVAELEGRSNPSAVASSAPQPGDAPLVAPAAPETPTAQAVAAPQVHTGHMGMPQITELSTHLSVFSM